MPEAHRHIKAVGHHVAQLIACLQFQVQLGIALHELAERRAQNQAGKVRVHVDSQTSPDLGGAAGRRVRRFFEIGQQWRDLAVETPALIGQGDGARGAVEQANAQAFFQPGDGAAHARWRQLQGLGGAHEAAAIDHGAEHAHTAGKTGIEAH